MSNCIWRVETADRHCEFCSFEPCAERNNDSSRPVPESYVSAMESVTGVDIRARHKSPEMVWARNMVAYQMFLDGYSYKQIAKTVGRDRCTIIYAIGRVQDMLVAPSLYSGEMKVWREFKKKLVSL